VGKTLFVGSSDTKLYALSAETGEKKWEYATDDIIGSSPIYAGGKIYVTSFDGRLYAFGN
jgi:outer membrane protein assembly factor BamB